MSFSLLAAELSLDDVLNDTGVRSLMQRDGVEEGALRALLSEAAGQLMPLAVPQPV